MRLNQSILVLALAFPAVAAAQESQVPSTRPGRPMFDRRPDGRPAREIWRERLGNFDPSRSGSPLSEQEKGEISNVMRTYSPERFRRLDEVPGEERKDKIFDSIAAQYRMLQRMKHEDPEIYDLRLKRLPIEDKMFELRWKLNHDNPNDNVDPRELRKVLREQLGLFVENCLTERRIRVNRAQALLQRAESEKEQLINAALENDRADRLRELADPRYMASPRRMKGATTESAGESE